MNSEISKTYSSGLLKDETQSRRTVCVVIFTGALKS
jgi:hypothetical protein